MFTLSVCYAGTPATYRILWRYVVSAAFVNEAKESITIVDELPIHQSVGHTGVIYLV